MSADFLLHEFIRRIEAWLLSGCRDDLDINRLFINQFTSLFILVTVQAGVLLPPVQAIDNVLLPSASVKVRPGVSDANI